MYSRHFYKTEDVKAALQHSIHTKKPYEAVFWAKELNDINDINDINLKETLFISWFYSIGLSNINCIKNIRNSNDETIFQMASIKSNHSILPYMLVNGTLDKVYKMKKSMVKLSNALKQDDPNIDIWIRNTLYGKFLESWQASLIIWDHDSFSSIIQTFVITKFDNPTHILDIIDTIYGFEFVNIIYRRCAIIGVLCMPDVESVPFTLIPADFNLYLEYLKSVYGKRKGRYFSLPTECFYGKTKRGTMLKNESNITELYKIDNIIKNQSIYEEIIKVFDTYEKFKEIDDEYERFFEYYFPDDIPEEWSLAEQQKSHGNGILEKDEKPSIHKYFSIYVSNNKEFENILTEYTKKYSLSFNFENDIIKNYKLFNMKDLKLALDAV
jgi:hypothetical protein